MCLLGIFLGKTEELLQLQLCLLGMFLRKEGELTLLLEAKRQMKILVSGSLDT